MEADNFRVFAKRYRLSRVEKLFVFLYFRFWPFLSSRAAAWELSGRASQRGGASPPAGVWQCFDDQQIGCEPLNHLTQRVSRIGCDNRVSISTPESKSGAETSSNQTSKSCAASPRDAAIAAAKGVSVTAIVACSGRSSKDLCRKCDTFSPGSKANTTRRKMSGESSGRGTRRRSRARHASARELHCW